ncbi:glycoside hydrolase family 2 TIM barrel-domain containing protein [Terriglobus sp. RCC_193]|uniref:glycoside hydrolase family 2 protein n=1 Tax=Terriglobus sp. RCC_193 TaxID=3239218 RepID=UPI0035248CA2
MILSRRKFAASGIAVFAATALPKAFPLPLSAKTHTEVVLIDAWEVSVDGKVIEHDATLPHTPVPLSWHQWEPASWEKVWTYRRELRVPSTSPDVRHFLHVERALANTVVKINGQTIASHQGGFTPFACEITDAVHAGSNELVLEVDSRWVNVPPSGSPKGFASVDYFLPGGLNGLVTLHTVPATTIVDFWSTTRNVLSGHPSVDVVVELDAKQVGKGIITAQLIHGTSVLAKETHEAELKPGKNKASLTLDSLSEIELWSPENPHLYQLQVSFRSSNRESETQSKTIGFREAKFELDGFYLNGKKTRLFGLNRHELFPYVGFGASPRAMRRDAEYLRHTLNCNVVRCSHYPQSTAFLDACDELGLLVWEEIPGWQYLGDSSWKEVAVQNVEEMIRRDRHHPSIIVWGTRINESANDPALYQRTRTLAQQLDPTRPTSGSMTPSSRKDWKENWHEDIFAFDDYHAAPDGSVGIDPAQPGVPYMNAEAVGQFSYGTAKNFLRRYRRAGIPQEQNVQAVLHAQAHDRAARDPRNAGVIAWCGFDYASPMNAYEGVKCPGVVDTFRIPKLGASFYRSQVSPSIRVVIEPSFYWDAELHASSGGAAIFSNCEELRVYLDDVLLQTLHPDRESYAMLAYAPFFCNLPWEKVDHSVLRIDGYVNGKLLLSRSFEGSHEQDRLWLEGDDAAIAADGVDSTRISFGVADRFGNSRPSAKGSLRVQHTGTGKLVGDTEFNLADSGAVGAVWLRSVSNQQGKAQVTISHADLGSRTISVSIQRRKEA